MGRKVPGDGRDVAQVVHGRMPQSRHTFATCPWSSPTRGASKTELQCVTTRFFGGGANIAASTFVGSTIRGRPERGRSSRSATSTARYCWHHPPRREARDPRPFRDHRHRHTLRHPQRSPGPINHPGTSGRTSERCTNPRLEHLAINIRATDGFSAHTAVLPKHHRKTPFIHEPLNSKEPLRAVFRNRRYHSQPNQHVTSLRSSPFLRSHRIGRHTLYRKRSSIVFESWSAEFVPHSHHRH
ncbi:hypothetical protein HNP11_004201 [Tsukamurella ocularis]|nr:hypothetical protein [Tsukamurella ocularis]